MTCLVPATSVVCEHLQTVVPTLLIPTNLTIQWQGGRFVPYLVNSNANCAADFPQQ